MCLFGEVIWEFYFWGGYEDLVLGKFDFWGDFWGIC